MLGNPPSPGPLGVGPPPSTIGPGESTKKARALLEAPVAVGVLFRHTLVRRSEVERVRQHLL
jgi:hypothetical protein